VQNCACQKPKDLGYSYELWTYKLLTAHVREHCGEAGHPALQKLSRSKLHKILHEGELRPHKVRYYVERRDPAFESKMANVLHVYKEVEIINEGLLRGEVRELGMVTISYDEKPGIQALAVTTADRPPVVGQHSSHLRDYEYKRLGTVSLLAGLDLHSGRLIETISNTHKSADFITFLKKLDGAYPAQQKIRLLLDNHSAHISRETRDYLDSVPQRFVFVFLPKHGSWLNLGIRNNNLDESVAGNILCARYESVVPVRMSRVPVDAECFHLGLCHLDARFVLIGVENCLHPESTLRFRGPDQIHDRLIVEQRLPFPGQADEGKQPVLDLVPVARSRRVMADRDGHLEFVRQFLRCSFQVRDRLLLLPPASAQIRMRLAPGSLLRPASFHH
jgi:hypothetical protein